jgi:hypothetical protein
MSPSIITASQLNVTGLLVSTGMEGGRLQGYVQTSHSWLANELAKIRLLWVTPPFFHLYKDYTK